MTLNDLYAKPNCKLLDHLFDVGYIAEALMTIGRAKTMVQSITDIIKVTDIVTSISWLCAVHDIGKAHPDFVSKMYPNYPELADIYTKLKDEHKVIDKTENTFRHERYSRDIIISHDVYGKEHIVQKDKIDISNHFYGIAIKDDKILVSPQFGGFDFPGGTAEKSGRFCPGGYP